METNNTLCMTVRCYAELNDFLPPSLQYHEFPVNVPPPVTVTALLAHCVIPSQAVDLVLVNGISSSFETVLNDGDRVSIFPTFESFDISVLQKLRDVPLRQPRFLADVHLGKLARLLRLFGFDTTYHTTGNFADVLARSMNEKRTILSMYRAYRFHPEVRRFYQISSYNPRTQLLSVLERFDLWRLIHPFTRCIECNTPLLHRTREIIPCDAIPPKVVAEYNDYEFCPHCQRYYWQGSHYRAMKTFVNDIVRQVHRPP